MRKVIKADVQDEIIFNTIEDVDTNIVTGITSVLTLPTGNLNNILIAFNFRNEKIPQEMRVLANFNIDEKECIDVPLETHTVGDKVYENACYIPAEVFVKPCYFMLGLYGFALDGDDTVKQRISLIPLKNIIVKGSYEPDAKDGLIPTPTAFEVYFNNVAEVNDQMQKNLKDYNQTLENKYQEVNNNMDNKYNEFTKNIDEKFAETDSILEEKLMYIKIFTSTYVTTTENETDIPINLDVFNEITPLEVEINGIGKTEITDYTIDYENKKIILTKALDVIGTPVKFKCLKTAIINGERYDLLKGAGVPKGGTTGQVLRKTGDSDFDTNWQDETVEVVVNETEPINKTPVWIKKGKANNNLLNVRTINNNYTLNTTTGYPETSELTRIATIHPIYISNYDNITVSYSINNGKEATFLYALLNGSTLLERAVGKTSGTTINTTVNGTKATHLYLCFYDGYTYNDINWIMVNEGTTALPYEPYSKTYNAIRLLDKDEYVDFKEFNQYSIVDIYEIMQPNEGYSFVDSLVYRDRNRYFGWVTVKKEGGYPSGTQLTVAILLKKSLGLTNSACFLSNSQWNSNAIAYAYRATRNILVNNGNVSNYAYAKIPFDFLVTEE